MITEIYHSHGIFTQRYPSGGLTLKRPDGTIVAIPNNDPLTKEVTYYDIVNHESRYYPSIDIGAFTCFWQNQDKKYYLNKFTSWPIKPNDVVELIIGGARSLSPTDIVSAICELEYLENVLVLIKELEIYKRVLGLE
jgi:hypothetical protein